VLLYRLGECKQKCRRVTYENHTQTLICSPQDLTKKKNKKKISTRLKRSAVISINRATAIVILAFCANVRFSLPFSSKSGSKVRLFIMCVTRQRYIMGRWSSTAGQGDPSRRRTTLITNPSRCHLLAYRLARHLQRGTKVTSLVARSSRGRFTQHLHGTRAK
jgi:hypothetical protein